MACRLELTVQLAVIEVDSWLELTLILDIGLILIRSVCQFYKGLTLIMLLCLDKFSTSDCDVNKCILYMWFSL